MRYLADRSGAVAVVFSLAVFVLAGCIGLAIDFSRGSSTKASLQQDLDATLLYVATERLRQGDAIDLQRTAEGYMKGLQRQRHAANRVDVEISVESDFALSGTARTGVASRIMSLLGFGQMHVKVASTTAAGGGPVELALVLDNTASMDGAKLDALKDAAKTLVDKTFDTARRADDVKIGIVPFAEYVNVGLQRRNEVWIDVPDDQVSQNDDLCEGAPEAKLVPGTCQTKEGSYVEDGSAHTYSYQECDFTDDRSTFKCSARSSLIWRGCVGSRNRPLDTQDGQYSTRIPGLLNTWCPQALMPLTSDRAALLSSIDAMSANGNTYVPIGLMWGWRILSEIAPFSEGVSYNTKINGQPVRKVLVLMTDGENSISASYPYHWGSNVAAANALTAEACTNIKEQGIEIFSVAFQVTDPTINAILESCASASKNFYGAESADALVRTFEAIATNLSALRIAR